MLIEKNQNILKIKVQTGKFKRKKMKNLIIENPDNQANLMKRKWKNGKRKAKLGQDFLVCFSVLSAKKS